MLMTLRHGRRTFNWCNSAARATRRSSGRCSKAVSTTLSGVSEAGRRWVGIMAPMMDHGIAALATVPLRKTEWKPWLQSLAATMTVLLFVRLQCDRDWDLYTQKVH